MDSQAFLARAAKATVQPIYVLHGDEDYLKRRVRAALKALILGAGDEGFGLSTHDGTTATYANVMGDVQAPSLLSPRRIVIVESADPFVTRERAKLEKYVAAPSASGVMVLEVNTWPANTKLAKLVPDTGTIVCKSPSAQAMPRWCVECCQSTYGKKLTADAAAMLVELLGADMGRIDQELAKLASFVGDRQQIAVGDVDQLVGFGRAENTWKIFDLIGEGRTAAALELLGRQLDQGEDEHRIFGAFSMQLRRLVQVLRKHDLGHSLPAALEEAGVPPFARRGAEAQLRHLGRRRIDRLYEWLLQTDLGLKSSRGLSNRALLERLVIRLARPSVSAAGAAR